MTLNSPSVSNTGNIVFWGGGADAESGGHLNNDEEDSKDRVGRESMYVTLFEGKYFLHPDICVIYF